MRQAFWDLRECRNPGPKPTWPDAGRPDPKEVFSWFFDSTHFAHDGDLHIEMPDDGCFSLRGCCETLSLDMVKVRAGVRCWLDEHPQQSIADHPTVRRQDRINRQIAAFRANRMPDAVIRTVLGLGRASARNFGLSASNLAGRHFGLDIRPSGRQLKIGRKARAAWRHFGLTRPAKHVAARTQPLSGGLFVTDASVALDIDFRRRVRLPAEATPRA